MTTDVTAPQDRPITSRKDLIAYLHQGCKPPEEWKIGVEIEKLVVDRESAAAAPQERIQQLLERLEKRGCWRGVREEGTLIALQGVLSAISLEPGGQLELSGQLCPDLHCSCDNFRHHIQSIVAEGEPLGLAFLGLGAQPFSTPEEIAWLPKQRYRIMAPYMAHTGTMGQRMMKQTAGIQVNLDYADEADCIGKIRLALALTPLFYAWSANSPLLDGRPSGFLTTRGEIWDHTDSARGGLIHALFENGADFGTYVDYALDVPMYFIFRREAYLDLTGEPLTFRRFLAEGFAGERATLHDWALHLSTLFPESRLRPQLEIRSFDSLPPLMSLGFAALCKGLLYDGEATAGAWSLFRSQNREEREALLRNSWRLGLKAPFRKGTLQEAAREVLDLARAGLKRQARRNLRGQDETVFLDPLAEIAASGVTPAERLLAAWQGSREDKVALLRRHCGY
jgi:glutamate--cysteine ligase